MSKLKSVNSFGSRYVGGFSAFCLLFLRISSPISGLSNGASHTGLLGIKRNNAFAAREYNYKVGKSTKKSLRLYYNGPSSVEIDLLEGQVNGDSNGDSNPKIEDISPPQNATLAKGKDQVESGPKFSKRKRFLAALPKISRSKMGDDVDKQILSSSLPSMVNMAVVPLVNAVDTFWVGRLGVALALAGQAAANQAFFMFYFFVSVLPTITAPMVAKAVGSGDVVEAEKQVNQALFLSNLLGAIGTTMLVGFPRLSLELILSKDAPSMSWAIPYLRFRGLSMIPALVSATGFAAYRGLMDTVTPLKVSLVTNLLNLITDPLLIFGLSPFGVVGKLGQGLGVTGAAVATAGAELTSGLIYVKLLLEKKLMKWSKVFKVPSLSDLKPVLQGAASMLIFQLSINVALTLAARRAQAMDPTGVTAAAYGIVMQMYSLGIVCHLGMKGTAAALIPMVLAKDGKDEARKMADKLFIWGTVTGLVLGVAQMVALPILVPLFSTLPEVQDAVKMPALISAFIQFMNGPGFAGEGILLGLGKYNTLSIITLMGASLMVGGLYSPLGMSLNGILLSMGSFSACSTISMLYHYLKVGPLRKKKT